MTVKYYTADWCQPCKQFRPVMDRVARDMGFTVEYIDIDANTDAAIRANVMSVPTWQISVNGVGRAAYTGAYSEPKLREIMSKYV